MLCFLIPELTRICQLFLCLAKLFIYFSEFDEFFEHISLTYIFNIKINPKNVMIQVEIKLKQLLFYSQIYVIMWLKYYALPEYEKMIYFTQKDLHC